MAETAALKSMSFCKYRYVDTCKGRQVFFVLSGSEIREEEGLCELGGSMGVWWLGGRSSGGRRYHITANECERLDGGGLGNRIFAEIY